jgi:hypothetical protein
MQEEDHQFGYTVEEQEPGSYKIIYSTSDASSELFFSHIKQGLERKISKEKEIETYIHEIKIDDLDDSLWNKFFDLLLKSPDLKMTLLSGKSVSLVRGKERPADEDVIEELEVTEQILNSDDEDSAEESGSIRKLGFDGKDIFSIKDIEDYKTKGFSLRNVVALYKKRQSGTADLKLQVSFGFNQYGRFSSEVHKTWLIPSEPSAKEQSWNLTPKEKEAILEQVNRAAFAIFDELNKSSKKQT